MFCMSKLYMEKDTSTAVSTVLVKLIRENADAHAEDDYNTTAIPDEEQ